MQSVCIRNGKKGVNLARKLTEIMYRRRDAYIGVGTCLISLHKKYDGFCAKLIIKSKDFSNINFQYINIGFLIYASNQISLIFRLEMFIQLKDL